MTDETLEYSPGSETRKGIHIEDYVPETMIKIYPYRAINGKKDKIFQQQNSVTIVTLSQEPFYGLKNLEEETNGKYFELFGYLDTELNVISGAFSDDKNNTINNTESFVGVINSNWKPDLYQKDFFTIGEPFDQGKYNDGKQKVFNLEEINIIDRPEILDADILGNIDVLDAELLSEIHLRNIESIEDAFTHCKILFRLKSGDESKALEGFEINFDSHTLVNDIFLKGFLSSGEETEIDILTKKVDERNKDEFGFMPIKMTPISVDKKTTLFADWFDYDVVMPLFIAKNFFTGVQFNELINLKKLDGKTDIFDDKTNDVKYIDLIADFLSISLAYSTNFSKFRRVTDSNSKDYGKIAPELTIGTQKLNLQFIEGQKPGDVLNSMFDTFLLENGIQEEDYKFTIVKQILAALSKYIYSNAAIGRGKNDFVKAYLPWYLHLSSLKFATESAQHNMTIERGAIELSLNSKWFGIYKDHPTINENVISDIKIISTGRKITIPKIKDTLDEVDKLQLPGDVSITSHKDLKYMFYVPADIYMLEQLYLQIPTIFDNNVKTLETLPHFGTTDGYPYSSVSEDTQYSFSLHRIMQRHAFDGIEDIAQLEEFVREFLKKSGLYTSYDAHSIRVGYNNVTLEDSDQRVVRVKVAEMLGGMGGGFPSVTGINGIPDYNSIDPQYLTQPQKESLIKANTGFDWSDILKTSNKDQIGFDIETGDDGHEYWWDLKFIVPHYFLHDVTVEAIRKGISINFDRTAVFDKESWSDLIYSVTKQQVNSLKYDFRYHDDITEIYKISISSLWGDNVYIKWKGVGKIKVPLFNKRDESLIRQDIIIY